MKKLTITLLWVCFAYNIALSQQSVNMQTYWTLRERFNKYFVRLGTLKIDGLFSKIISEFKNFPFKIHFFNKTIISSSLLIIVCIISLGV